ncbi:MAG: PilZ domain-containing protein [Thermodesulfobacteriota bacterium]
MNDEQNKRRGTRVVFNVNAELSFGDQTQTGEVRNLSLKGMLVDIKTDIPAETELDIKIYLSGTSSSLTLSMKGRVVRCDENGLAVLFKEIDVESFIHLRSVVGYNEGNEDKIMREFYDLIEEQAETRSTHPSRR